jgi:hypothetical protein
MLSEGSAREKIPPIYRRCVLGFAWCLSALRAKSL